MNLDTLKPLGRKVITRRRYWCKNLSISDDVHAMKQRKLVEVTDPDGEFNLVSSLATDGYHYPALDIDVPCRYVKSSTEGHGHLYFDETRLSWEAYIALLAALANAGIISHEYMKYSLSAGMTTLRPSHVRKSGESRPAKAKKLPKPVGAQPDNFWEW